MPASLLEGFWLPPPPSPRPPLPPLPEEEEDGSYLMQFDTAAGSDDERPRAAS